WRAYHIPLSFRLQRTHANLISQAESLTVVGGGLVNVRRVMTHSDFTDAKTPAPGPPPAPDVPWPACGQPGRAARPVRRGCGWQTPGHTLARPGGPLCPKRARSGP